MYVTYFFRVWNLILLCKQINLNVMSKLIYSAAVLFLLVSCSSSKLKNQTNQLEEATKAIAESNAVYFTSFEKNDSSIFVNRYAKDACIMAPFAPQACGPEEAEKFFKMAYDQYGLRGGKFITTAIYGSGDGYVTEEGFWQSVNEKGEMFDDGKFLVLWKKTENGWKMFRDSFSSNHKN